MGKKKSAIKARHQNNTMLRNIERKKFEQGRLQRESCVLLEERDQKERERKFQQDKLNLRLKDFIQHGLSDNFYKNVLKRKTFVEDESSIFCNNSWNINPEPNSSEPVADVRYEYDNPKDLMVFLRQEKKNRVYYREKAKTKNLNRDQWNLLCKKLCVYIQKTQQFETRTNAFLDVLKDANTLIKAACEPTV